MMKKIKKEIKHLKHIIEKIFIKLFNGILIILPLQKEKILFLSDVRQTLGGNLENLYNFIPDNRYKKVISTKADRRIKRILKEKIKLVYNLSTAKYILLEDYVTIISYIKARKGQEIVQLWHGAGAFKKFGNSRLKKYGGDITRVHSGYKKYTKAITSSEDIRPCYAEAFNISIEKVKATGFPRTDMFFDEKIIEQKKSELYKKYPFLNHKKVILFAPTFRGTKVREANYDFNKLDLEKIYNEFKDEYVFIFKWHPAVYNNIVFGEVEGYDFSKYENFYYDLSKERDINDLLLITDLLITDYSSVIFDYVFMKKPVIYFAYDLEDYKGDRGLYFPFEEYVYGKVAIKNDELIQAIKEEDMQEEKREKFKKKFLEACDGHSTEKTYRWIFEDTKKRNNKWKK